MTIKEKVMKMNELVVEVDKLVAEVDKLAEEIKNELDTPVSATDNVLSRYINDSKDVDITNYWLDSNGEVVYGQEEYLPNNYNPYCNYMRKDYADKSAKLKKFYDILFAFKWSNDKDYEPDWTNTEDKYYIYYDVEKSKYDIDFVYDMVDCTVYFKSSEIAEKCANYLTCIDPEGKLIK